LSDLLIAFVDVDVFCINQQDIQERNQQVIIMSEIYRAANRVVVWLGEGDTDSDWAIDRFHCSHFHQEFEKWSARAGSHANQDTHELTAAGVAQASNVIRASVFMMLAITNRRWWTRLWVYQEVMLTRQDPIFLCGRRFISWMHYDYYHQRFMGCLNHKNNNSLTSGLRDAAMEEYSLKHPRSHINYVSSLGPVIKTWSNTRNMMRDHALNYLSLPMIYRSKQILSSSYATDPRDYVYAVRGLLPSEEQAMIPVDYAKHPMEVYNDAMVAFWTSSQPVRKGATVSNMSFHRPNEPGIPSWVPDLSAQKPGDVQGYNGVSEGPISGWREAPGIVAGVSRDRKVLELQGVIFDSIREYYLIHSEDTDPEDINDIITMGRIIFGALGERIPVSSHLHMWDDIKKNNDKTRQIIQTLTLEHPEVDYHKADYPEGDSPVDDSSKGNSISEEQARAASVKIWEKWVNMSDEGMLEQVMSPSYIQELHLHTRNLLFSKIRHKKIFITNAGFIGVGPKHLEVGDMVVFPFGMNCPWLVRPEQEAVEFNQLVSMVGCVFVWDLMHYKRLEWAMEKEVLSKTLIRIK